MTTANGIPASGGELGGAAGTFDCFFDNFDPFAPFHASQMDTALPFSAEAAENIPKGASVTVVEVKNLVLRVTRDPEAGETAK